MFRTASCLTVAFFIFVSQAGADDSGMVLRLRAMRAEIDAMISQLERGVPAEADATVQVEPQSEVLRSLKSWHLTILEVITITIQNNPTDATSSSELTHRILSCVQTYDRLRSLQRAAASEAERAGDLGKSILTEEQEMRRLMRLAKADGRLVIAID